MKTNDWHPIESAPRDGNPYLAVDDGGTPKVVRWNGEIDPEYPFGLCAIDIVYPTAFFTHWMPLPEPPAPSATAARRYGQGRAG